MKIHMMPQGSDEWKAIRKGKMTASNATAIGNCGAGLDTYVLSILADHFSSGEVQHYSNKHMDRGNELEEPARAMYELEYGATVEQVGFVEYNDYVGCSPDGLLGEDGGIEIKCHEDLAHFKMILNGEREIASGYLWQIQMNMLITGRKYWLYIAYNPNFEKSLLVFKIYPDPKMHAQLLKGFAIGEGKIKAILNQLTKPHEKK